MKVYVLPLNSSDLSKTEQSLSNHDVDYEVLPHGGLNQIWKVPKMEGHGGVAVVVTSNVTLKETFDPSQYPKGETLVCFTEDKDVFVLNCSNPWFKQVSPNTNYMGILATKRCEMSEELRSHFAPEVSVAPEPEPVPEPDPVITLTVPEPAPEPEPEPDLPEKWSFPKDEE